MKYLIGLFVLLPGMSLAHGGHGEIAGAGHDLFHAAPLVALAFGVLAAAFGIRRGRGS